MKKRLIIMGAGGHGKVIADIALRNEYIDIAFLDDHAVGQCLNFPIVGKVSDAKALNDGKTVFVIAVGNNATRKRIAESCELPWVSLVHPSAQIGTGTKLGIGTVVMANAVINPDTIVGQHCIINSGAVVEHDNVLDDYVHISPNAALGGTVHVGEQTHIGIGAVVKNNINICAGCVIGAGAVVVKDVLESCTVVGCPAKVI